MILHHLQRLMRSPSDIALLLPAAHAMLNSIRAAPIDILELPGARVGILPGDDSPFASATKNRATIYDPTAADLIATLRRARDAYTRARVTHWFAEIAPGSSPAAIAEACAQVSARPVPFVRYPVLARSPGILPPPPTILTSRRASPDEIRRHAPDIDAIWGKPGASAAALNAAGRAGFAVVLARAGDAAVAMGILIAPARAVGGTGGLGYLSSGGTAPAHRRHGAQSALIAERLRIAAEWGCAVCVSEAVVAGDSTSAANLQRAGFHACFDWTMLEIGTSRGPRAAPPAA